MCLNQLNTTTTIPEAASMDLLVLPEHLMYEILLLLPVKSLLTFRTLSRHWRDTLSSGNFAMNHCQRNRESGKKGCYYVITYSFVARSITLYPETGKPFKLDVPKMFKEFRNSEFSIQSSCRGIICAMLHGLRSTYILLWNPVTRVFMEPFECAEAFVSPDSDTVVKFALGFNPASNEYKVVIVRMISPKDIKWPNRQIVVLSLKTKSVKIIEDSNHARSIPIKRAVSIDGYIFWLANGMDNTQVVLKFDLASDHLSKVNIPPEAATKATLHEQVRLSIHECNGSIRLLKSVLHENIHWCINYIWLLSTVDESWKDVSSCYKGAMGKFFRGWDGPIGLTSDSVVVIERKVGCEGGRSREEEEGVERVRLGGSLKDGACQFLHWESLISP